MTQRKRLLILTPRFPYPVIGGDRLRIHAICKALAREYSLTLLSLCESRAEFDPQLVTDSIFDRIERVHLPRWRSLMQVALALPSKTPLQVSYYRSRSFAKRIADLLPDHDLAVAHLIRTGNYLTACKSVPTVLEMTDAISMNYDRVRKQKMSGLRSRIYAIEHARLLPYEQRVHEAFSAVSLIASADARYLWDTTLPNNLIIAANGVDGDALPFRRRDNRRPVGIFIGNMCSMQNMDACRFFVTEVMPLLSAKDLEEFRVVGRIGEADADWLRMHPRVKVTGEVDSIPDAVADGTIGLCPVRLGAGVQNKVLEYMALGLPVVCSAVGHEGIGAVPEKDILTAQTPDEFAAQIRRLNIDPALFQSVAKSGRRFVDSTHSWESTLDPLLASIRSTLEF